MSTQPSCPEIGINSEQDHVPLTKALMDNSTVPGTEQAAIALNVARPRFIIHIAVVGDRFLFPPNCKQWTAAGGDDHVTVIWRGNHICTRRAVLAAVRLESGGDGVPP